MPPRRQIVRNLKQDEERQGHLLQAARNGHVSAFLDLLEMGMDPNHRNVIGDTAAKTAIERGNLDMVRGLMRAGYAPKDLDCKDETALTVAVKSAVSPDVIMELIKYGADPDEQNNHGISALQHAVMKNDLDAVKIFLAVGADIQLRTKAGVPLLHFAVEESNTEMIDLLVEHGAKLDGKDKDLLTALHIAADQGDQKIFQRLFDHYQENNIAIDDLRTMDDGWNPLMIAAMAGHVDILKILVKHGVPLHMKDHEDHTALALAIEHNQVDAARFLIEHGADVAKHDFDEYGQSLLHLAIESKKADQFIPMLIQAGIPVDTPNDDLVTPLAFAVEEKNAKAVKYLLEAGADPNQSDISGRRPLDEAVRGYASAMQEQIVQLLLAAGADINETAKHKQAKTSLYHAFEQRNAKMIDLFVENGADITARNPADGQTPIFAAFRQNNMDMIERAISLGANLNDIDDKGQSLLHIAVRNNNNLSALDLLLKKGGDVNVQDHQGRTPLHLLASGLWPRQVDRLIKAKANPNLTDDDGNTALHAMAENSNSYGLRNVTDHLHHFDTCLTNKEGMTPLMLAARKGHRACVDILVEGPAKSLNVRNPHTGRTALSYAIEHNQAHIVSILVEAGAKDLKQNAHGHNLLHLAAQQHNGAMLETLLPKMHKQVNQKDKKGETPLFHAIRSGKLRHVIEILKFNPDLTVRNKAGQSLLDIANEQSNLDLYEVVYKAEKVQQKQPKPKNGPKR